MLDPNLMHPHRIINEDGRILDHPGFMEFHCAICGKVAVKAIGNPVSTCGYKTCNQKADSQHV